MSAAVGYARRLTLSVGAASRREAMPFALASLKEKALRCAIRIALLIRRFIPLIFST
ncbi:MAG: hypothetical protein RM022_011900 [Nostoc sp. EfeVER01]|uniref:hypothetical protein n=1 Tax=Nostoc sp. EfeVER01 TaxID=3075406 RepID=UPI002AD2F347|nr:hypothetical protein [Nostoc sp. EfeVER01]MDZ7946508.1 hypothetical protein [Nostoc sp. EfeVER01]